MLVVVSLAFGLVLEPFWGCIFGLAPSLLFLSGTTEDFAFDW